MIGVGAVSCPSLDDSHFTLRLTDRDRNLASEHPYASPCSHANSEGSKKHEHSTLMFE